MFRMYIRFVLIGQVFFCSCMQLNNNADKSDDKSELSDGLILSDLKGNDIIVDEFNESSNLVLFYLSPECPLCQNYSVEIRKYTQNFSCDSIRFIAVFPGSFYSTGEIRSYMIKYELDIDVWLDEDLFLCEDIGATITPEVFIIGRNGRVKYQGAIDNWAVSLGRKRSVTTKFYLRDALSAIAGGKEIQTQKTEAVGCLIEL